MNTRAAMLAAWLVLVMSLSGAFADEPPVKQSPVKPSPFASLGSGLLGMDSMAQAATDLRKAGEAFERFGRSLDGLSAKIAESLAAMSSEFDPFGYKTAFQTLGQQSEMLQQQRELIHELQEREIERLRSENERLRKELDKRRKRKSKKR